MKGQKCKNLPHVCGPFNVTSPVTNFRITLKFHHKLLLQSKNAPENFSSIKQSCQKLWAFKIHLISQMPTLNDFFVFLVSYIFITAIGDKLKPGTYSFCHPRNLFLGFVQVRSKQCQRYTVTKTAENHH